MSGIVWKTSGGDLEESGKIAQGMMMVGLVIKQWRVRMVTKQDLVLDCTWIMEV